MFKLLLNDPVLCSRVRADAGNKRKAWEKLVGEWSNSLSL